MNILVCVKHIPDMESIPQTHAGESRPGNGPDAVYRMNRYDEYTLEEAVLIRERFPDAAIDAVTVGPARCEEVLRKAIAQGADRVVHIRHEMDACVSPFVTASLIAAFARSRMYDLILTGVMAEDDMMGITGPLLSAMLNVPCASSVIRQQLNSDRRSIRVTTELEGGFHHESVMPLPALLTIQTGINRPRYPALSRVLRAKKQDVESILADALASLPSREEIVRIATPEPIPGRRFLEGSAAEKADELIRILHQRALL